MSGKCPNLVEWIDWIILLCDKGKSPYVPDIHELRKYCKTDGYHKCPFYMNTSKTDGDNCNHFNREVTAHEYLSR